MAERNALTASVETIVVIVPEFMESRITYGLPLMQQHAIM
jgi:hypothetical protein